MAKTVKDIMFNALISADLSASQIMGHVERAHAYTELAKACAAAIQCRDLLPPEAVKSIENISDKEISQKDIPQKKEEPVAEKAPEQPVEEKLVEVPKKQEETKKKSSTPEIKISVPGAKTSEKEPVVEKKEDAPILTEKWTSEAKAYLKKEMEQLHTYIKHVRSVAGEDGLRDMISCATDGYATSLQEITPLNLKLVVDYIAEALKKTSEK